MEVPPAYDAQTLPAYALHSPASSESRLSIALPQSSLSFSGDLNYKSGHLKVSLGRRAYPQTFAVYGFNALVNGTLQVTECKHVKELTASLEATLTSRAPGGVMINADLKHQVTVLKRMKLHDSRSDYIHTVSGEYPLSIPFPTYLPGTHDQLPPSHTLFHLTASHKINYSLRIELVRRGLRKREILIIPILYLPRTMLSGFVDTPKYSLENGTGSVEINNHVRAVRLLDESHDQRTLNVNLMMPVVKRFASGDSIPLTIVLSSSTSPALVLLWSKRCAIRVEFIKRSRIYNAYGASVRDVLLSEESLSGWDSSVEGVSVSRWTIQAGISGQEMTWRVRGVANLCYLIRISIRPPDLPGSIAEAISHEEYIDITTDQFLPGLMDQSLPALGLLGNGDKLPYRL